MAQEVGYWENSVVYKEGPFVFVRTGTDYRIEVELKESSCPVIPDVSIFHFLERYGFSIRGNKKEIMKTVDFLNRHTKNKTLTFDGHWWVWKKE